MYSMLLMLIIKGFTVLLLEMSPTAETWQYTKCSLIIFMEPKKQFLKIICIDSDMF